MVGVDNVSTGLWALYNSNASVAPFATFIYGGGAGFVPVAGDWNSDQIATIGLFNYNNGKFLLSNSNASVAPSYVIDFSLPGAQPVVGAWNGAGTATIGLYSNTTGNWYLRNMNTIGPSDVTFSYGISSTLKPMVGMFYSSRAFGTPNDGNTESGETALQIAPTFAP